MSEVLRAVGIFCSYAVLAVFAQSAVFTRGLGVSRLVQLVGDDRTTSWWFALLLCVTQLLVAPLAFYAGRFIAPLANRAQLRPVVYVACVAVVCIFEHLVLRAVKGPRSGQLLRACCEYQPAVSRLCHAEMFQFHAVSLLLSSS